MTKQVIVLRKDLNMRKGKMVAQGAHASMKIFFDRIFSVNNNPTVNNENQYMISINITEDMKSWIEGVFTKVCVSVDSEEELLSIYEKAKERGIPCSLIQDIGLTEFGGVKTYTSVAVGPADPSKVDDITGHLKLL